VSPADKGRKNEGLGAAFRSRFTARFAYDSFDPNAKTKILIYYQDGKMIDFDADLSKVK
jgi:predicted metalloprotease with PDZ domain